MCVSIAQFLRSVLRDTTQLKANNVQLKQR